MKKTLILVSLSAFLSACQNSDQGQGYLSPQQEFQQEKIRARTAGNWENYEKLKAKEQEIDVMPPQTTRYSPRDRY